MRLLRLLSTGKSLVGMRDHGSSYHVNDDALLPKFERKKNPFRATTLPSHPQSSSAPASSEREAPKAQEPQVSNGAAGLPESVPSEKRRTEGTKAFSSLRSAADAIGKWIKERRTRWFSTAAPVRPKRPAPAQAELSLEMVTVVRNDLADSDIEVVPRSEPAEVRGKSPAAQLPAAAPEAVADAAWTRVSARVFGPENVT